MQDVNSRQYYQHSAEAHPKAYGSLHVSTGASIDVMAIGSVLAQTVLASGSPVFTTDKGTESLSGNPAKVRFVTRWGLSQSERSQARHGAITDHAQGTET